MTEVELEEMAVILAGEIDRIQLAFGSLQETVKSLAMNVASLERELKLCRADVERAKPVPMPLGLRANIPGPGRETDDE